MGSRYGGIKQLEEMGPDGETLLDFSVYDARKSGFARIVFVIRRDLEAAFRETVGSRYEKTFPVDYAFQELEDLPEGFSVPAGRTKPWGTGQAILAARNIVSGPFAVINADDFYGRDAFRKLVAYFEGRHADDAPPCCLVAYKLAQTLSTHGSVNRGICQIGQGVLQTVREVEKIHPAAGGVIQGTEVSGDLIQLTADAPVSMNCWGFDSSLFPALRKAFVRFLEKQGHSQKREFYLPAFVDEEIQSGHLQCEVLTTSANWFGVTYPEDRDLVRDRLAQLVAEGTYPRPLMP